MQWLVVTQKEGSTHQLFLSWMSEAPSLLGGREGCVLTAVHLYGGAHSGLGSPEILVGTAECWDPLGAVRG